MRKTTKPDGKTSPAKVTSTTQKSKVDSPQKQSRVQQIKQPSNVASLQRLSKGALTQQPSNVTSTQQPSNVTSTQQPSKVTSTQQSTQQPPNVTSTQQSTQQPPNVTSTQQSSKFTPDQKDDPRGPIRPCYFNDGIRRIDYILVWEEDLKQVGDYYSRKAELYRKKFEDNLMEAGVELEREISVSSKKRIHYVKLFVSWGTMCYYAEYLGFRTPLEQMEQVEEPRQSRFFGRARSKSERFSSSLESKVLNKPKQYYTCAFSASKQTKYVGISNKDAYFRPTQRFEVAYEVLGTQVYGRRDLSEVGLDSMIRRGIYSCAFPPHEGAADISEGMTAKQMNSRQLLHNFWARWKLWYKTQPLDHIREYFGEKIAFYFAFTGYYTAWLVPASLMGVATFLFGLSTMDKSVVVREVCQGNSSFKMCPLCDNAQACHYWYLKDICNYIRASYVFDHIGTHVYTFLVSIWAYGFLEFWKRETVRLAYQWDMLDFIEMQERPRPEYTSKCTEYAEDPVTGAMEPHFPKSKRRPRICIGILSLMLMMLLSTGSLTLMLAFRASIMPALLSNELVRSRAVTIANASSACVNLILVLALELIYEKIAFKITEWEMHRTQTQFENQVIIKVFIFEIFNHYLSISYTAFIKNTVAGGPGDYTMLFGARLAECVNGSCMFELTQIMMIIMVGKQIALQVMELLIPKLLTCFHVGSTGLQVDEKKSSQPWDADYMMIPYDTGLFMDYLEMVMQFGFVTLFVPAFPLAPLFALINNLVEIRLDARKLVLGTRRPLPERAQGIGIWFSMLKCVTHLATISNGSLMAFTSESLAIAVYYGEDYKNSTLSWAPVNSTTEACRYNKVPPFTQYYWRLQAAKIIYMLTFHQVVFGLSSLISWLIPDVPKQVRRSIQRQRYLAKQALIDREALGRRGKRVAFAT